MTSILYKELLKCKASLSISLSKNLTYKFNFLFMMTIPVFVFFAIKYSLWSSIYATHPETEIKGYNLARMIEYQFWILIFDLFIRSHFFSENISRFIRLGRISSFLLYPFPFIAYQFNLFLSDKILQFFIACVFLILVLSIGWIKPPILSHVLQAGILVFLVALYWFFIQILIGFLSFWLDETWSLNLAVRFISFFLSGSVLPLDLFPQTLAQILYWTPFPYLIYFPIQIIMGQEVHFLKCFGILSFWVFFFSLCTQLLWKKGLKLYSGAGL